MVTEMIFASVFITSLWVGVIIKERILYQDVGDGVAAIVALTINAIGISVGVYCGLESLPLLISVATLGIPVAVMEGNRRLIPHRRIE